MPLKEHFRRLPRYSLCVILALNILFFFTCWAQEDSENAADYYQHAFELLQYSYKGPLGEKVKTVVKDGWQAEHQDLQDLLSKNEQALLQFKQAVALKDCVFTGFIDHVQAHNLTHLVLLKGRFAEYQANPAQAVDEYLGALTFAGHISQDNLLISVKVASSIKWLTLHPLQQYLEKEALDLDNCRKILSFLQDQSSRNSLAQAAQKVKQSYLLSAEKWLEKLQKENAQKESLVDLSAALGRSFQEAADEYYAGLIEFDQTNAQDELKQLNRQINALRKKHQIEKEQDFQTKMQALIEQSAQTDIQEIARGIAELLILSSVPDFAQSAYLYYLAEAKARLLEVGAAMRIYAEQNGQWPQELEGLVGAYLTQVPVDPWSPEKEKIRYIQQKDGLVIYSCGPDRKDNLGRGTGYETTGELEGKDMLLTLPKLTKSARPPKAGRQKM